MKFVSAVATCVLALAACSSRDRIDRMVIEPQLIRYQAVDFAFSGPAQTIAGPTTVRLVNAGTQLHHAVIARIDSAKTLDDILAFYDGMITKEPPWLTFVGGPGVIAPGDSIDVLSWLEPGSYALICFVDIPDMIPHVQKGMISSLTVTRGPPVTVAVPDPQVEIRTRDYAFTLSTPLTAGTKTIRVVNDGPQVHDLILVQLNEGVTAAGFLGAMTPGAPPGPPPGRIIGGIGGLSVGQQSIWTVTLDRGSYALICAVPDREDGVPHFAHGMVQEFTI